ncbi:2-oxo-4-hydroxy-4-carboxy-5-ureidoimidazoline decarboxylase [Kushneria aurantia]|uniref:2-oxo-4-hydroxy-4-carboxy-5-ureidoimidazoline decarboxylase n=1 Tax=Kushneria aurantia TaxID=504092 RepID=A0ABV6G4B3_9GAMM|nr:2-oxo-4-hydroxy-4-carboxy-5-ureidoimidazoline decarboxylase [Kushneria aurantia]
MSPTLEQLNSLPADEFVDALKGVYEYSPWVAQAVEPLRPFESERTLHAAMQNAVDNATPETQLALIRAHPELGQRQRDNLTAASRREQQSAGLDGEDQRVATLITLNQRYHERHGFPFVIAVRGLTLEAVLEALETRLPRDSDTEMSEAIAQIGLIARGRLNEMLG